MSEVFGAVYADTYDLTYGDKDYEAECDLLERVFERHGAAPVRCILDLGCGTGTHALALARRGYEVEGVDRSAAMLAQARRKAGDLPAGCSVAFHEADLCVVDLGRPFDAVLMMFAVLGYQVENSGVRAALRAARRHLRPGGLLVVDVWYGPAVLRQLPSQREKTMGDPAGQVVRRSAGRLDLLRQVCRVQTMVRRLDGGWLVAETEEEHLMRYFFPKELEMFMECEALALRHLGAFPEWERLPDETTWNVLGIARAVEAAPALRLEER